MFSTSGDVQYIGGCSVHRGVFSTLGDTMSTSGGYHEYIGGDIMSTSGVFSTSEGYHEYIGGCSVHQVDTPINAKVSAVQRFENLHTTLYNVCSVHRGMFSTSGGVQYIGGYHEYIGGIP